jgi:hypothetical protein
MRLLRPLLFVTIASCGGSVAATGGGGDLDGGEDSSPAIDGALPLLDAAHADDTSVDAPIESDADASVDAPIEANADASAPCVYGTSVYSDISAGQAAETGYTPSAIIDGASSKLLVATTNTANSGKPALFRCNLDGTACTYTDISAGQGANSGSSPSAVIDGANSQLLVVTNNGASSSKPALFRCNLDGTGCVYADISAGQGVGSGVHPSAVFDAVNGKLLVVTTNAANMACRPALFRCNPDGLGCAYTAPPDQGCASWPSAVLDAVNGKLLVVASNNSFLDTPYLMRCDLAGSCNYSSLGISAGHGLFPSAVIDVVNGKLLAAATDYPNSFKAALIRCNLDGSGCALTDISAGQGTDSGTYPSAVIDAAHGKLLVVTQNGANSNKPGLFRCDLDGTSCTYTDISAGQGADSGWRPSAVLDAAHGALLVVTMNGANGNRPGLFSVCVQ